MDSSNEEEWLCYYCNPAPIASHKALATSLLQLLGAGKNQRKKAPPRRKRPPLPLVKSKEFISSTSGSEDVAKEVVISRQDHTTKATTPTKKAKIAVTLSPKSKALRSAAKAIHENHVPKSNGVSGAVVHKSTKRPIVSSSSDDGVKFRRHKRKRLSPPTTSPQLIDPMSDDSDFDLSATPVSTKKAFAPLSLKREKGSTSESVCTEDVTPMAEKKAVTPLSVKRETKSTSGSVCNEDMDQTKYQHKKETMNARAHHTLVSLDDTLKATSSESSDSGDEVKSEDISLSDDDVFESVDLLTRQKPHIPKKQAARETNGISEPKSSAEGRQSISLRIKRLSKSEYRPPTYNGRDESGSSSDLSIDKAASDCGASVVASSPQRSSKRKVGRLESTSSGVSGKKVGEKRKRCLVDDLSSGSEYDDQIVEKPSQKSLLSCLSSDSDSVVDAGNSKNMLGSAPAPDEVELNGVFSPDHQDVEYQVR